MVTIGKEVPRIRNRIRAALRIHGMDCAEEVSLLKRELSQVPGVYELGFEVMRARLDLEFDPGKVSLETVTAVVARLGMRAERWSDAPSREGRAWADPRLLSTVVSALLLAAGTALEVASSGGTIFEALAGHAGETPVPVAALGFYVGAMLAGFLPYASKTVTAARAFRPDMNVLVALSMAGGCGLGEWSEAATLAFLFGLANLLEAGSLAFARRSVGALLRIFPQEATVMHSHGEHRMAVAQIPVGATVRVRPGDRIPCDGVVLAGASEVDQALITGESVPIPKQTGSQVWAGTMNGEGWLDIRTTRAASDSTLARMVRMVEGSPQRRARSEQFVARFSRYYTPATIAVAVAVALFPPLFVGGWGNWFYHGLVVLLFACPCALVISTPVTIASALASAAREGVLVKGGAFLEEAARLDAVAFDKTGVLTAGRPDVERVVALDGHDERQILECLGALEEQSEHPVARALAGYVRSRGLDRVPAEEFEVLDGRGAEARIGGRSFWAGSNRLVAEKQLATREVDRLMAGAGDPGRTSVACGDEDAVWAVVALHDPVRPGVGRALEGLRRRGLGKQVLVTGDNEARARAVASALGFEEVRWELLPEEKAGVVGELRRLHGTVAMVGDGRNDAPALAAASLGIALGDRATDVALETADVVLMSGDLAKLEFLVDHARRAAGVVRQNVGIALGWKALFLIAAAAGAGSLWLALMADMGATLLVVFNGLRLLRARPVHS